MDSNCQNNFSRDVLSIFFKKRCKEGNFAIYTPENISTKFYSIDFLILQVIA